MDTENVNLNPTVAEPTDPPQETITDPAPVEPGDTPADHDKKPDGVQKRINDLVRQREDERRRAEYWEQIANEQLKRQEPQQPATTPQPGQPLNPDSFETYEQFLEAVATQKAREILAQEREASEAQRQQAQQAQVRQNFQAKAQEAAAKYEDFHEVAANLSTITTPIHPIVESAVMESDMSGDLVYYLGKNPAEAQRISQLAPARALIELGKIEAKLAVKPPPKPTNAPPPVTPVGSKQAAGFNPDTASMEDFIKWRKGKL